MTYEQFTERWAGLNGSQRMVVRRRAATEHMTIYNTFAEYWGTDDPEVNEDED